MEGKAIYNAEDIYHSETWDIKAYITYTDKREIKSQNAKKALRDVICFISKTKCSFAGLVDNYIEDSDTLAVIMANAYALNQYIKCLK